MDTNDENVTSNVNSTVDAMSDEMERMSGEGGVAPLMPHRQPTQAQRITAKEEKNLRM